MANVCDRCGREFKTPAAKGAHQKLAHGIEPAHGTIGGYLKHKRDKEKACVPCRSAWAAKARQRP